VFVSLALLIGCRPGSPLPEPSSIESLCLGAPPQTGWRIFKFPGIESVRNDQLVKAQDLHVDVDALGRIAASAAREVAQPELSEDEVRLWVTQDGGGVLVWWNPKPVALHYKSNDPKIKHAKADMFGAAVSDDSPSGSARTLYLLERPAGSAQPPAWRAFAVTDDEHVCT
jgi:hypothetical protein